MSQNYLSIEDLKDKAHRFLELGNLSSGLEIYLSALVIYPENLELHLSAGFVKGQLNLLSGALEHFKRAAQLEPDSLAAYSGLALCAEKLNDWTLALQANKKSIFLISRDLQNSNSKDFTSALSIFKRTVDIYRSLSLEDQALKFIDETLALYPDEGVIYTYKGLLCDQKRSTNPCNHCTLTNSVKCYERAILINSSSVENHYFLANLYSSLKQWQKAVNTYKVALKLKPAHVETHNNIAVAYHALNQAQCACYHFKKCIEILDSSAGETTTPQLSKVQLFFNAGAASILQFNDEEARVYFERALLLDPWYPQLLGAYVHLRMKLCDWHTQTKIAYPSKTEHSLFDLDGLACILIDKVYKKEILVHPFTLLSLTDNAQLHLQASKIWAQSLLKEVDLVDKEFMNHPQDEEAFGESNVVASGIQIRAEAQFNLMSRTEKRKAKIRIGYFSSDFKEHATAYLIASLFELHNRDDFELIAYSWSALDDSAIRKRLKASFDRWYEVQDISDTELVSLARSHKLSVAVDLKGYTQGARTAVFALRVAPVQIAYLGYAGTLGGDFMDYCLVDKVVVPPEMSSSMSEKLIRLPPSYQVNDYKQNTGSIISERIEHGLPPNDFILCALNSSYKITKEMFSVWMSILLEEDQSIIWLLEDTQAVVDNLRGFALQRGVNPDRLVFAKRIPHERHLERLRHADLFLDTFPCNAHTSASDALWSAVPVVTMCGGSFASRVAASLLSCEGLSELVTDSLQGYENKVLELLKEPKRLSYLKAQLATKKEALSMPLFDTHRFVLHYERSLNSILKR